MLTWHPDFCPDDPITSRPDACEFVLQSDWSAVVRINHLCAHHAGVKLTHGLTDQQTFEAVLQSSRVKESARAAAKSHLGLEKDHPGVPYRVEPDGSFTIGLGEIGRDAQGRKQWAMFQGWPAAGAQRQNLVAAMDTEAAKVTKLPGTSTFKVA